MPNLPEHAYAQSHQQVTEQWQSRSQGLNPAEAAQRLQQFGPNSLPAAPPIPAWLRLLRQFHNVLIYVLLISAFISAMLGHYVDTGVIIGVVVINAIIGFIQEGKAESALRGILSMVRTHCLVLRDGKPVSIDSEQLVPGDIVMLQAGDKVPADLRLFYCKDLHCDEALLTGESQTVAKHTDTLPANIALADRKNMAYMGSMVTFGTAQGIVVATGQRTEIGSINKLTQQIELPQTPLQQQLARFGMQLTIGILLLTVVTTLLGLWIHQESLADMLRTAIAIAVAAIPEGLPAIVTITLAIGVQRMAHQHALLRRLPAVEILGAVDVICSDKTGTLTANAMTTKLIATANQRFAVSGDAYSPLGDCLDAQQQKTTADTNTVLHKAALVSLLCNDSHVEQHGDDWVLAGDPTEGALHVFGLKTGLTLAEIQQHWPRVDELPFETERRYMATLHPQPQTGGSYLVAVKGAPDRLLEHCDRQLTENGPVPLDKAHWQKELAELAGLGMRVMAVAYKELPTEKLSHDDVQSGLIMLALAGITDPPRPEAIAAIADCHRAGIRVKMITGDNAMTAAAIGKALGLNTARTLTGQQLDQLSEAELDTAVEQVDIFARTSPANKLQLVQALQKKQHIVAMTGDGVNDAPALRSANIGIAMGKKGTDAAKEAADFVLTDDNFSTIASAVKQGRTVYDNIVKSITFILPTNLAEAGIIVVAILLGYTLPVSTAQILWVNMVTAITLALALSFEGPERNIMQRRPRPAAQGLLSGQVLRQFVLVGSATIVIISLLFHAYYHNDEHSLDYARTIAVNAMVCFEIFYLLTCRFRYQSIFSRDFLHGLAPVSMAITAVLVLQMLFTYSPATQRIFEIEPISLYDWAVILAATSVVIWITEGEKAFSRFLLSRPRAC